MQEHLQIAVLYAKAGRKLALRDNLVALVAPSTRMATPKSSGEKAFTLLNR